MRKIISKKEVYKFKQEAAVCSPVLKALGFAAAMFFALTAT